jgi:hypothetical protein
VKVPLRGEQVMRSRKIVGLLQILIILALGTAAITFVLEEDTVPKDAAVAVNSQAAVMKGDGKITIIPSPKQDKEETPTWANETTAVIEDLGQNLALKKTVADNGNNDVYEAKNVVDGIPQTYWEGMPAGYPNIITVDLETSKRVSKVRVRLNPEVVWSKRVQNFSVLGSADGKTFNEVVSAKDYDFDPKTGNLALVAFDQAVEAQFIQLQFFKNTGASAAQISEFEVY